MLTIGGSIIKEVRLSRTWGVVPGAVTGVSLGQKPGNIGNQLVVSVSGVSIYGKLDGVGETVDPRGGSRWNFRIVDNRERLQRMLVFGAWNIPLEEGDPGYTVTKRQWKHLLPDKFKTGDWTYTQQPMKTVDVVKSVIAGAVPSFSFTVLAHSSMNETSLSVDCLDGRKVADVISEVNSNLGIDVTINGASSLKFDRRGIGAVPQKANAPSWVTGEEASGVPTRVTVVGGRNLLQANGVSMDAAWSRGWEKFISEPAWLAEVDAVFGPFEKTRAGYADRAAKAREVTLSQYIAKKSGLTVVDYEDRRRHGSISRMDMTVWRYLNDIVFKSYAVAADQKYGEWFLNQKDLVSGMLQEVKTDGSGNFSVIEDSYYPAADALIVGRGQPVDLADVDVDDLSRYKTAAQWKAYWADQTEFNVLGRERVVLFSKAVFLPGEGLDGLFLKPNENGDNDIPESMRDIIVPNPNFKPVPAEIRAALVFDVGRYMKTYGSGDNHESISLPELALHVVAGGSGEGTEIVYDDGEGVIQKSDAIANHVLDQSSVRVSGSFTNRGVAGVTFYPTIREATVILDDSGLSESISFEKDRGSSGLSAIALRRVSRVDTLDAKSSSDREEVRQLRKIAAIERAMSKSQGIPSSISSVLSHPSSTGGSVGSRQISKADQSEAGTPIFVDADGAEDRASPRFGGVTVAKNDIKDGAVMVAHQGTVPVRVQGPFSPGDAVGVDNGADFAKLGGERYIGTINEKDGYSGTNTILARVMLGSNGVTGKCPVKPIFAIQGDEVKVSFTPTYISQAVGGFGSQLGIVPKFNDVGIIDNGEEGWSPPVQVVGAGQWTVYLVVFHGSAKLLLQSTETDPPEKKEENQVYKIAEFTVAGGEEGGAVTVQEKEFYHCPHFNSDLPYVHEAYPFLWNAGTSDAPDWKIRFTPATVTDVDTGNNTVVSNPEEEFAAEADDEFHLKHSVDKDGNTTSLQFVKQESPTTSPYVKGEKTGEYYRKIVKIAEDDSGGLFPMIFRSFGIDWQAGMQGSSSSDSGSSSSSGSGSIPGSTPGPGSGGGSSSSTSSGSGSGKDTAIVPAPWLYHLGFTHTAYFAEECPEVIFSDWFTAELKKRVTRIPIDPRFVFGTVDDTIRAVGIVPDKPWPVAVRVQGEQLVITRWPFCKLKVTGRLSGVRMGFKGVRYPKKTKAEFLANEAWLKRGEVTDA